MIKSFRNKELKWLYAGETTKIGVEFHARLLERLDVLDAAHAAEDMNIPGYDFHGLRGFRPKRYTVHVNGPWCLTFAFENGDAYKVDFEQYH